LEVRHLNGKYDDMRNLLRSRLLPSKEWKKLKKLDKAERKAARKKAQDAERLFVLNFHGDIKATAAASLREEVTAILTLAGSDDAVLLRLENMGGIVHEHGLAASQVKRLKDAGIHVTVAVDKVAASGGYMMACVADRIVAAPFAVLGSIGVLAQLPNFHEMLKRHGIAFEQETAGEYKRTITMFGENTEKERAKLREQIEQTHALFKAFVARHRPSLDLEKVATGEIWYGSDAVNVGLVDEIQTSDDFLLEASKRLQLYEVTYSARKSFSERLVSSVNAAVERVIATARGGFAQSTF
jgi:serine protease SohB